MADTIAGRYTLIDPIARGGSGSVWRAWDGRLQQLCAAKVLRQRDSADLLRFAREQSVKLEHPHVLAPYGWAAEDVHVVIAMPLVHGGTLESALLDNGAASVQLTEEILSQLLRALQFVHAQGWVHRDVKPGNLMLDSTGTGRPHVYLSDFGIAVRVEDARLTRTGTLVGTPGYLPPEAYDLTDPHPAQDLYAAGVTALRLLDPSLDPQETLGPHDARAVVGEQGDLAEYVAALLTADPALRCAAAASVLDQLTETAVERTFDPARTRDGEPFEIFDVLDPLPEPWAGRLRTGAWPPGGPPPEDPDRAAAEPGAGASAGAVTAPDALDSTPRTTGAAAEAAGTGAAGYANPGSTGAGRPSSGPAASAADPGPGAVRTAELPSGGPGSSRGAVAGASAAPGRGRARRRGAAVAGVLLGLIALTAAVGAYLLLGSPGSPGPEPGPGPTVSPVPTDAPARSPVPEETPVVLERVCETVAGGREVCTFRAT